MGRHNQHAEEPLDQTGPATRYSNRSGAYADDYQGDNDARHCLDATHDYATGSAVYGRPGRRNTSHR